MIFECLIAKLYGFVHTCLQVLASSLFYGWQVRISRMRWHRPVPPCHCEW